LFINNNSSNNAYQRISPGPRNPFYVLQLRQFLRWGVVSTSHKHPAGGPTLIGCLRLLIQYIRSYPPYWMPFLDPQPEDAPCPGDRDPVVFYGCVSWSLTLGEERRL